MSTILTMQGSLSNLLTDMFRFLKYLNGNLEQMLSCFIASKTCRSRQRNIQSNDLYIFVIYLTTINNTLFPMRTRCRYYNIIIPRIAKAGAKSETEIITIFTNFSFVSYATDEGIFNISLLD